MNSHLKGKQQKSSLSNEFKQANDTISSIICCLSGSASLMHMLRICYLHITTQASIPIHQVCETGDDQNLNDMTTTLLSDELMEIAFGNIAHFIRLFLPTERMSDENVAMTAVADGEKIKIKRKRSGDDWADESLVGGINGSLVMEMVRKKTI